MKKGRLEAFSDGVLAIIVTIMVLELKVPHGSDWHSLLHLWPKFLSYVLSFAMVWIYWNNHHHMMHTVERINGNILLVNGLLLFCLSMLPFATAWMGENHFSHNTVAFMGMVLLACGVVYFMLSNCIIHSHGKDSTLAKAVGNDFKGKISVLAYLIGIVFAFWWPLVSLSLYVLVALMWLLPDRRIEKVLHDAL